MYDFKNNSFRKKSNRQAFTLVETAAALLVLSIIIGSVMVLVNRYTEAVMDMQLREQAFEIARSNMETLLAESKLSDTNDSGTSETNPGIEWETIVEPFYEPVTNRMWIRAVCSAGFKDTKGEFQDVELEHWITNLTAAQIKQILAQQQVEQEYMELINAGEESALQETTRAYLEQQGLDTSEYDRLIKRQRREKLEYLAKEGFEGYEEFVESLKAEENEFLENLGMDFEGYNDFAATYIPKSSLADNPMSTDTGLGGYSDSGSPSQSDSETTNDTSGGINWDNVPKELWPVLESLGLNPPK